MVCTGNICRSPMAEGLLREMLPGALQHRVQVESAGTHGLTGNPAEPFAVQAAAGTGADISTHRARELTAEMVEHADLVLAMETAHAARARSLCGPEAAEKIHVLTTWGPHPSETGVFDPYGFPLPVYERCAQIIRECLKGVVPFIERTVGGRKRE